MKPIQIQTRIVVALAALLPCVFALSCSTGSRSGTASGRVSIVQLFPVGEIPLGRASAIQTIPKDALGVVVAGSLHALEGRLTAHVNDIRPARVALGAWLQDTLGYDVLDTRRMAHFGIDVNAPVALAWLDIETFAVVVPLSNRTRFIQSWTRSPDTMRVVRANHAVIAFNTNTSLDTSDGVLSAIPRLQPADSLASHTGINQAVRHLHYAPDALFLVNTHALHGAIVTRIYGKHDDLGIDEIRSTVEVAEHRDERDAVDVALDQLSAAERQTDRLQAWRHLVDVFLDGSRGAAIGVGFERKALKVQGAFANARTPDEQTRIEPLPRSLLSDSHSPLAFDIQVRSAHVMPLVRSFVTPPVYRKLGNLIAALGGHTILNGAVALAYPPSHPRAGRADRHARIAPSAHQTVRIGLRDPGRTRAALSNLRPVPGWNISVVKQFLRIESARPATLATEKRKPPTLVRRLAAETRATATWVITAEGVRGLLQTTTETTTETTTDVNPTGRITETVRQLPRKHRETYTRLIERRRTLSRALAHRNDTLARLLTETLGVGVGVASRRGPITAMYSVHEWSMTTDDDPLRRSLQLWYENSRYSPNGKQLAELDQRIRDLEHTVHVRSLVNSLRDNGGFVSLDEAIDDSGVTIGVLGGVLSGVPSGNLSDNRLPRAQRRSKGTLLVTASMTHAVPSIDRTAVDRSLLHELAALKTCYGEHRVKRSRSTGYVIANVRLQSGQIQVDQLSPANTARNMNEETVLACIRTALEYTRVDTDQRGSGTITLWFGVQ